MKEEGKYIASGSITDDTIKQFAFWYNNLLSITFPETLTTIESNAFNHCENLQSISLPKATNSIQPNSFGGCANITSITVDKDNQIFDSRENCNAVVETATATIALGCKNTTIPSSIKIIGNQAFSKRWDRDLVIPENIVEIKGGAYSQCTNIKTLKIPNSVKFIGGSAFSYCSELTNVTIPCDIGGSNAFTACTSLTNVVFLEGVTRIGYAAFTGCSNLKSITIPSTLTNIGQYAFNKVPLNNIQYNGETYTSFNAFKSAASGNITFETEFIQ